MQRLKSNRNNFFTEAVHKAQMPVTCPTQLTEQEHALFLEVHSVRQTDEWRGDDLHLIAEYARLSVQIAETSFELSACRYKDRDLLFHYDVMLKMRDNLRKHLRLNISAMHAKTQMLQKGAADKVINNIKNPVMTSHLAASRIDWKEVLDV